LTERIPQRLRAYYGELFGWEFDTSGAVAESVSEAGNYGFVQNPDGAGIPGGVGGGASYHRRVLFYVGVPDVEAALREAERLGGVRTLGPDRAPERQLVVGHFSDPEGNLIGVAGTASNRATPARTPICSDVFRPRAPAPLSTGLPLVCASVRACTLRTAWPSRAREAKGAEATDSAFLANRSSEAHSPTRARRQVCES
jgi:predicted enzyme related to lactoylglutathione lyase